jgi:phasin family protein
MARKPTPTAPVDAGVPTLATVDDAPAAPASAVETTTSTPTQGMKNMMKSTEDFVAFGKENLEAFTAAGKIWAAGVQELTQQVAATAKASIEESVETFKALSAVKSVKEAIELQSAYSKSAVAKALAESTKLTEASMKLTEQAMAPITARVTVAVQAFSKAA